MNSDLREFMDVLGFEGAPIVLEEVAHTSDPLHDEQPETLNTTPLELESLQEQAQSCRQCKLAPSRNKVVFGSGHPKARLMFVGEGPGADEDQQGLPFVGQAGQLLTKMIHAMGLKREDVYIANIIKCRPPQNRNPEPDEIEACFGYLKKQVELVSPEVIVALGSFAAKTLLQVETPITRLRGKFHSLDSLRRTDGIAIELMPTFHPAFLLRNPAMKKAVWEDLQQVMQRLGLTGS